MLDITALGSVGFFLTLPAAARNLLFLVVGITGVVAAVLAALTREDAFEAAGRQSKWAWVAIVGVSGAVCLLQFPLLAWFGAVAIGLYYFDVRPQINDILRGNSGW